MRRLIPQICIGVLLLPCPWVTADLLQDDDQFYVLQVERITTQSLTDAPFQWLIVEPSRDGNSSGDFTPGEVLQIRTAGPCPKTALAYLSIGEAEDYRDYWNPAWVDAGGNPIPGVAPAWLGPQNPDFLGNYKVRYWMPEWQNIIFGVAAGPDTRPFDRIINQGFDGVYLDIVDAFEFWSEPEGGNELTRMNARALMIDFVVQLSEYARITRGVPEFRTFPQNASEIIRDDDDQFDALTDTYFNAISGIGQEDLYYDELLPQPVEATNLALDQLREFVARGKTVLVTDYVIDRDNPGAPTNDARVADFYARSIAEGLIPYAAFNDRDLDEIVTLDGAVWSVDQPTPACPAILTDLNGDGLVNPVDLAALLGSWGPCAGCPADFNNDGTVNPADLAALLGCWTP